MKEIIFILEKDIKGGYTVHALEFFIYAQEEILEELKLKKDALKQIFDEEDEFPKVIILYIVKKGIFSYA